MCRGLPIKFWDDSLGTDEPSEGWNRWRVRLVDSHGITSNEYVTGFRILGYCYWDAARLEGCSDMFSQ